MKIYTESPWIYDTLVSFGFRDQLLASADSKLAEINLSDSDFKTETLVQLEQAVLDLAERVGVAAKGRELNGKIKAQLMDWGDNFYERIKNKKVAVISSSDPLKLAGGWIPGLVRSFSAQYFAVEGVDIATSWGALKDFRADVIIVAPRKLTLEESCRLFKSFEKSEAWQEIPAVKRGEVIFCAGDKIYQPGVKFLEGAALLISAIAGFESGFITPKDSFFRLRWLELQRHKI